MARLTDYVVYRAPPGGVYSNVLNSLTVILQGTFLSIGF